MKTWGGGGSRKSSNVIRGNHFSEVTFQWSNIKRGDRLNFTLFSPKSSVFPSPAINNDRSFSNHDQYAYLTTQWLPSDGFGFLIILRVCLRNFNLARRSHAVGVYQFSALRCKMKTRKEWLKRARKKRRDSIILTRYSNTERKKHGWLKWTSC